VCQRGLEAVSIAVEAGRNAVDSFPLVVIASLIGSGVQRLQVRSPRLAQAEKSDFVGRSQVSTIITFEELTVSVTWWLINHDRV
jgi:predicted metal-dependent hydrolase